ncbi:hypothetical protein FACS189437_04780 [Bacteroidia bacterium]|nr:hypothetical protein FACS189437_04780 [Bacteroidia bacterium]
MTQETAIKLFEEKQIRTHWDEQSEEWYFSVTDVVAVLTESSNPRDYWFKMKQRVTLEDGIELSTICRQLKMMSSDGKNYNTDCANVQALLRIIQSIPSPKAEPFKQWLAKVGYERMQETLNPEQSIDRARDNWLKLGRSEKWIQLSTRQIAESKQAKGFVQNAKSSKKGGRVAKNARKELESETGKSVITGENFLPPTKTKKKLEE